MLFGNVIKEAGLPMDSYPNASKIQAKVFDGKNRELTGELKYHQPFFVENNDSAESFKSFVQKIEETKEPIVLSARIDEFFVTVWINSKTHIFRRKPTFFD